MSSTAQNPGSNQRGASVGVAALQLPDLVEMGVSCPVCIFLEDESLCSPFIIMHWPLGVLGKVPSPDRTISTGSR